MPLGGSYFFGSLAQRFNAAPEHRRAVALKLRTGLKPLCLSGLHIIDSNLKYLKGLRCAFPLHVPAPSFVVAPQ